MGKAIHPPAASPVEPPSEPPAAPLVEHDVDEHNATVTDVTTAASRHQLEQGGTPRALHLGACEPGWIHYRMRGGGRGGSVIPPPCIASAIHDSAPGGRMIES